MPRGITIIAQKRTRHPGITHSELFTKLGMIRQEISGEKEIRISQIVGVFDTRKELIIEQHYCPVEHFHM